MRLSLRLFCLETELKIQFVDLKQKNRKERFCTADRIKE